MLLKEAIEKRRSIRKYRQSTVSNDDIREILTAAMMAPSACNTRPWEFVVIRNIELLKLLSQKAPAAKHIVEAGCAIVVLGIPQSGAAEGFWPQDCGAATENILLKATDLGYATCWCGIYPKEAKVKDVQQLLATDNIPFNIISVGIADEAPSARGFYEDEKVTIID